MNENRKRTVLDRAMMFAVSALIVTGGATSFVGVWTLVNLAF